MIQIKDVYKVLDKSTFHNINLEIKNNTIILGNDKDFFYKVFSYLYNNNYTKPNYFYISKTLNKQFSKVKHLVREYLMYYKLSEIVLLLERYNINFNDKISTLSFSNLKLLLIIIAIRSNCEFIIIDDWFDLVDNQSLILELINNSNSKIITTGSDLGLSCIIKDFIYINEEINIYNFKEFSSNYIKLVITVDYEVKCIKTKVKYVDIDDRNIIVILNKDSKSDLLKELTPIVINEEEINFKDISKIL